MVEELGADAFIYGTLAGIAEDELITAQQITARIHGTTPPHRGETVRLKIDPSHVHVFSKETGDRLSPTFGRESTSVAPGHARRISAPRSDAGGRLLWRRAPYVGRVNAAMLPRSLDEIVSSRRRKARGGRSPRLACQASRWEDGPMPRFLAAQPVTQLISLPWATPLEEWPEDNLVALPRGISRHVVRFVRCGNDVFAVKEVLEHLARHEYRLLRDLTRLDVPSVEATGVVTDRVDAATGEPLDPILITRHLQFSLPYRSLFSRGVRQDTVNRLVDAMVVLLARLHLIGFLWGDVSLSNTLFRRDAGAFAAYLVDAETGELHDQLTNGQREHDLTIARTNLFGEFSDLEAGGLLDEALDPLVLVETIEAATGSCGPS